MKQNGEFLLFNRDEFHQWLFSTQFNRSIKLLQVHHTASPTYKDFNGNNYFDMLNSMKAYHIAPPPNGDGFSDIAQNLTTFPDGLIAVCRNFNKDPAGIFGANTGAICVENIGNFDNNGDIMSIEHKTTIIYLYAVLAMRFNIPINTDMIIFHNWFDLTTGGRTNGAGNTKTCPGTRFFGGNSVQSAQSNFLPLIQTQINNLLNLIQPWMADAMNFLLTNKYITVNHNPLDIINFGILGSMLNNRISKISNIDPIKYLLNNRWISITHNPLEPVTMQFFAFMIGNHLQDIVTNPIDYLLQKGFITQPRSATDVLNFALLGAMLMNASRKGINL